MYVCTSKSALSSCAVRADVVEPFSMSVMVEGAVLRSEVVEVMLAVRERWPGGSCDCGLDLRL